MPKNFWAEAVSASKTKLDEVDNDWENGILYGIILALIGYYFFGNLGGLVAFALGFMIGYGKRPRFSKK